MVSEHPALTLSLVRLIWIIVVTNQPQSLITETSCLCFFFPWRSVRRIDTAKRKRRSQGGACLPIRGGHR